MGCQTAGKCLIDIGHFRGTVIALTLWAEVGGNHVVSVTCSVMQHLVIHLSSEW